MRVSIAVLSLMLAVTPALADNSNELPTKQPPKAELKKEPDKMTTVNPEPAPPMDPSAGSGGNGAPVAGSSNGNET